MLVRAGALTAAMVALLASPAAACEPFRPDPEVDARRRPVTRIAPTAPAARHGRVALAAPKQGRPSRTSFRTTLTRNPDAPALREPGFTTPADECAAPVCRELAVEVSDAAPQALYVRASWPNRASYVHVWGIAPDGAVTGRSQVFDSFDKTTGNETTVPLAEFTVADPRPGTWRIQVRAVFGYEIDVETLVALTKGPALVYPKLDVRALADRHLTQHVTMNVVFAGREWTAEQVAEFREQLPGEVRAVVHREIQDECGLADNNGIFAVEAWKVCHYTGTQREGAPGAKPYLEPIKLNVGYRFLAADGTWTRDLYAAMKAATTQAQPFRVGSDGAFATSTQGAYLAGYDAQQGRANRGPTAQVADPTVGDKIDAYAVEDWIFEHRLDRRYARSFRDLETGETVSGRFINPDPGAYFDPFYTATGRRDLERIPQGAATSLTFFVLDTFTDRDLTDQFFRPDAYHFFDVSKAMPDPDTRELTSPDFARVWGGRYRFFVHDLGAGPNSYESAHGNAGAVAGSASYPNGDPPVWDYDNDPRWQGLLVERTARDAATMLLYRFMHSYAYRPIPADVYLLASNVWHDCYANPECDPGAVSYTELTRLYDAGWVERNLGAALPGATFRTERSDPRLTTYRYLGCATRRAIANPTRHATGTGSALLAPDPHCVGKRSDPIQEVLEVAKANGDDIAGPGNPGLAFSAHVVRKYVEEHRDELAPQPPGQFTITNVSTVFPGTGTWFVPVPTGGGVALSTPNGEAWGILQNVNDAFKPSHATDCARSKPIAPGCGVVPENESTGGLSYVTQHEAAHFLGMMHPHDSYVVEKDADGKWQYYGYSYRHYGDFSQAPTTYAGPFAPYSVLDQDILQRGHAAEYLRQAQDWLADAYLLDGAAGLREPSALTRRKAAEAARWRDLGSAMFACGDYLRAERAMRNASLAAQGTFGPVVPARLLQPGERVLFEVVPRTVYGPGGEVLDCAAGSPAPGRPVTRPRALPATGGAEDLAALGLVLLAAAVVRRRATSA